MADQKFDALYTNRLLQKQKKWQDGFLILTGTSVKLYNEDKGLLQSTTIDVLRSNTTDPGEFKIDGYLIQCEEIMPHVTAKSTSAIDDAHKSVDSSTRPSLIPAPLSFTRRAGGLHHPTITKTASTPVGAGMSIAKPLVRDFRAALQSGYSAGPPVTSRTPNIARPALRTVNNTTSIREVESSSKPSLFGQFAASAAMPDVSGVSYNPSDSGRDEGKPVNAGRSRLALLSLLKTGVVPPPAPPLDLRADAVCETGAFAAMKDSTLQLPREGLHASGHDADLALHLEDSSDEGNIFAGHHDEPTYPTMARTESPPLESRVTGFKRPRSMISATVSDVAPLQGRKTSKITVRPSLPASLVFSLQGHGAARARAPAGCKLLEPSLRSTFNSISDYASYYQRCIVDEINFKLDSIARSLSGVDGDAEERQVRARGVEIYKNALLIKSKPAANNPGARGASRQAVWYLKFEGGSLLASKEYAQNDLWIVTPSLAFDSNYFAVSDWHAPSNQCMLGVTFSFGSANPPMHSQKNLSVSCIRCFNVSSEVPQYMAFTDALHLVSPSFVSALTQECSLKDKAYGSTAPFDMDSVPPMIREIAREVAADFTLNEGQLELLHRAVSWVTSAGVGGSISLAHGVFGSGKSYALEAIIIFLCRVADAMKMPRDGLRIMVCSLTNAAVDRILLGLHDRGFSDFTRVGSLRRIAKPLLKQTLHFNQDASLGDKDALVVLKDMLKSLPPGKDRDHVAAAIKSLDSSIKGQETLLQARVVGATAAAASIFPVLREKTFQFIFIDEASQMVEPQTVVPMQQFKPSHVLLVGDPLQLPPTLSNEASPLATTMFVRLEKNGMRPIKLHAQYRLHPVLSHICNHLFYSNQLKNGVSAADRSALIPNLPPLLVFDLHSATESKGRDNSWANDTEANAVLQMLRWLLRHGVEASQIGVIALYRAQAFLIYSKCQNQLREVASEIRISTVDAFQGAECEIILLSTVRVSRISATGGSAFSSNPNRMNVALSRGKRHLMVFGSSSHLLSDNTWKYVYNYAESLKAIRSTSNMQHELHSLEQDMVEGCYHNDDIEATRASAMPVSVKKASPSASVHCLTDPRESAIASQVMHMPPEALITSSPLGSLSLTSLSVSEGEEEKGASESPTVGEEFTRDVTLHADGLRRAVVAAVRDDDMEVDSLDGDRAEAPPVEDDFDTYVRDAQVLLASWAAKSSSEDTVPEEACVDRRAKEASPINSARVARVRRDSDASSSSDSFENDFDPRQSKFTASESSEAATVAVEAPVKKANRPPEPELSKFTASESSEVASVVVEAPVENTHLTAATIKRVPGRALGKPLLELISDEDEDV